MTTTTKKKPAAKTEKAVTATPERETRMVPLADLYLHKLNPRQSVTDEEIDALAESIAAIGLMQNLLGIEQAGPKGGKTGIVAGGRRLRALAALAKAGKIDAGQPIAVKLALDEAEAETWASAENTARMDLHPAAEIDAYRRMAEKGSTVRTIAKAFAVSERHVERRLKLAGLAPQVLKALAANKITLEQAAAFTVGADHKSQVECLNNRALKWDTSAREIRGHLTREATREGRGLARFVTRAEYEAAGGAVREDLFGEAVFFDDGETLQQVADKKLEALGEAETAAGWSWVEIIPGRIEYDTLQHLARTYPEQAEIPEDDAALYDELAGLIETESATAEQVAQFEAIEALLNEERYSAEQKAVAGVAIGFDYNHTVIVERGLIRKEDRKKAVEAGIIRASASSDERPKKDPDAYSAALTRDLTAIRTAAVQQALLDHPALALDLLAYALNTASYHGAFPLDVKPGHPERKPTVPDGFDPDERVTDEGFRMPVSGSEATKRFVAFRKKPQAERTAMLTQAIAASLGGGLTGKEANTVFETVATETGANVRTVWTPTGPGFFKRLTGAQLDRIWMHLHAKRDASNFTKKKADKVAYLHALFTDPAMLDQVTPEVRERVAAWVPKGMEVAAAKPVRKKRTPKKSKAA